MNLDFTLSLSHIITLVSLAAVFGWNWFLVKSKTDKALEEAKEANEAATRIQNKVAALELQMLKEYASMSHIQAIESRLTEQMRSMADELRDLNKFLRNKS